VTSCHPRCARGHVAPMASDPKPLAGPASQRATVSDAGPEDPYSELFSPRATASAASCPTLAHRPPSAQPSCTSSPAKRKVNGAARLGLSAFTPLVLLGARAPTTPRSLSPVKGIAKPRGVGAPAQAHAVTLAPAYGGTVEASATGKLECGAEQAIAATASGGAPLDAANLVWHRRLKLIDSECCATTWALTAVGTALAHGAS
jgi:hypothetical protein